VHAQGEIKGPQREVDPAAEQSDATVPRSGQQIGTEQVAYECENRGIRCGMEAMATVVDTHACELEAAGVAADVVTLLEDLHGVSATRKLEGCAESGGPGAKDRDARHDPPGRRLTRAI
jgi:hypothetical protein